MADVEQDFLDAPAAQGRGARMQRIINLAGAVSSVALILGLAFWGYRVAVRDVQGVPVVRAIEGPMRIPHPEPGGAVAPHLGLAVNAVVAEGEAAPVGDRLLLAPRPAELADEDLALAELAPAAAAPATDPQALALALAEAVAQGVQPLSGTLTGPPPPAAPGARRITPDDPRPAAAAPLADPAPAPADVAAADPGPAPPGAILRSPRPAPRPGPGPGPALAAGAPVAAALPPSAEIAPEDIARGTRLVQVGAYGDAAEAIAAWDALRLKFGDLLADKARVLQTATSGGRSFVRLRVHGFADEADARRFCSALLAENADCLPVLHRS